MFRTSASSLHHHKTRQSAHTYSKVTHLVTVEATTGPAVHVRTSALPAAVHESPLPAHGSAQFPLAVPAKHIQFPLAAHANAHHPHGGVQLPALCGGLPTCFYILVFMLMIAFVGPHTKDVYN